MLLFQYASVLAASIGLLFVALTPGLFAWVVAIRHGLAPETRRPFAISCALLSYGVLTLAALPFIPFAVAAVFLAPQLDEYGHKTVAVTIFVVSEYAYVFALLATVIAAILVPLRLRHSWPGIVAAYRVPRRVGTKT